MDPVTAFSIACGVIQVVDFSSKVVRKVWTIVKSSSGTLVEYEELEKEAVALQGLMNGLRIANDPATQRYTSATVQGPNDVAISNSTAQAIRQIASQCGETSKKIINLLNEIKADPEKYKSTFSRAVKAMRSIPKSGKISKLESQLEEYRKRMEQHIIIDLRQTSRDLLNGMAQGFGDLLAEHKVIVAAIANNESNLSKLVQLEVGKIRADVAAFANKVDEGKHQQELRSFIESFAFADMFNREDRINQQPAAPRTFRWLFDKENRTQRPYDSFSEWLEGNDTIYWICGKAGSGKSTLMGFIWDHPDSKMDEHLREWSGRRELITARVFFWSQGSRLQKSPAGLLQSLVYQILQQNERRANRIMELQNPPQGSKWSWTRARLLPILYSLLEEPEVRVCFFIDGLDEYGSGDVVADKEVVEIIFDLIAHANGRLKCCLSSRPLPLFEHRLQHYPKLMLHKLTSLDIAAFAADSLGEAADKSLIERIVLQAEGVFLWAFFAVKSLQTAHLNGDTIHQIRRRLYKLPSELDDLYSHMLLQIDPVYWREAALFLALSQVGYTENLSVVHYVLASQDSYYDEWTLPWTPKRIRALRKDCASMERWLKVRTAGLLEVEVTNIGSLNELTLKSPLLREHELEPSAEEVTSHNVSESRTADLGESGIDSSKPSGSDLNIYYDLLELDKKDWDPVLAMKSAAILSGQSDENAVEHSLLHRKVMLIHRSVAQFLERETENKILKLCPEGTALMKHVQANVVLLTFRDKFGFEMNDYVNRSRYQIYDPMYSARRAELCTKQANRPYIDKLGSVLQTVEGLQWPCCESESLAITFLGFAARCRLNLYVQDMFKNDMTTANEHRQTALNETLWCAVGEDSVNLFSRSDYTSTEQLELIRFLLDEGADPNETAISKLSVGEMTAWEIFLNLAMHCFLCGVRDDPEVSRFDDAIRCFVAHGADPNQQFVYSLDLYNPRNIHGYLRAKVRANAVFLLKQFDFPCDPARAQANVEAVVWLRNSEPHIRAYKTDDAKAGDEEMVYLPTPEGEAIVLESILASWKTKWGSKERSKTGWECYRILLELRKSAHDPEYIKPPLAEFYEGGPKPVPEDERKSDSDSSDEPSDDEAPSRALSHALSWWRDLSDEE